MDDYLTDEIARMVVDGNIKGTEEIVQKALEGGADPLWLVENGLSKGMRIVGEKFEKLEIFLPEMILAAEAMNAGVARIKERLGVQSQILKSKGKVVLGTVQGDVHDIGKNIVKIVLEAAGFDVIDLGKDVPVGRFIDEAERVGANIIGVSALMTTTMVHMPQVVLELKERGLRDKYAVIFGGAPVLPEWSQEAGADGCGKSATEALELCKRLSRERR